MRSLLVSFFALCLLLPAARADEWNKTYTLTGKPDLRVETSDANIQVDTWDKLSIEARVVTERYKIGEDGIKIFEHQTGDTVELEVRFPHHHISIYIGTHIHRVDIQIHMPREGRVYLHTGEGNIRLLKGLDKPIVWVFPKLQVCLDCGFTEFSIPEAELRRLAERGSTAST